MQMNSLELLSKNEINDSKTYEIPSISVQPLYEKILDSGVIVSDNLEVVGMESMN